MHDVRKIIESAGAVFLRVTGDSVYFRDLQSGATLSLYQHACNLENVALAIHAARLSGDIVTMPAIEVELHETS